MSIVDTFTEVSLEPTGNEYADRATAFLKNTETRMFCRVAEIPFEWRGGMNCGELPALRYYFRLQRGERTFRSTFTTSIADTFRMLMGKPIPSRLVIADNQTLRQRTAISWLYRFASKIKPIDPYNLLACLQKYPCEDHADFCSDYGYDVDSIKGRETWIACREEYRQVAMLYNEGEMLQLREIN